MMANPLDIFRDIRVDFVVGWQYINMYLFYFFISSKASSSTMK